MLLAGTLLFIGLLSGLSTCHSILTGRGGEFDPDWADDPEGHESANRFNIGLTAALFAGGTVSLILGY